MLREQLNTTEQAKLEFSIPENFKVQRILVFLKKSLVDFESAFTNSDLDIHKEDDISNILCPFFNDRAKDENLIFHFNSKVGVDFTIFVSPFILGAQSVFMIEAKRLSKDHYDYVKNPNGGIERFKREQDGFGKHLIQSALIGYIQQENKVYWETRINRWIDELIETETDIVWDNGDKLVQNYPVSDFVSTHHRVSEKPIKLYHFWINLN
jgi:hypothetical protein